METKERKRKMTGASHIEVTFWFESEDAWRRFAEVPIGRKSLTISQREWDVEPSQNDEHGYVRRFRFIHTCRNTGAHRSDTRRFIMSTAKAAGMEGHEMDYVEISLLDRSEEVPQVNLKLPPERLGIGYLTDTRFNTEVLKDQTTGDVFSHMEETPQHLHREMTGAV